MNFQKSLITKFGILAFEINDLTEVEDCFQSGLEKKLFF